MIGEDRNDWQKEGHTCRSINWLLKFLLMFECVCICTYTSKIGGLLLSLERVADMVPVPRTILGVDLQKVLCVGS